MSLYTDTILDTSLPLPHVASKEAYEALYAYAKEDPEKFWGDRALQLLDWFVPFSTVMHPKEEAHEESWFAGGTLNACYNCLDRHILAGKGDKVALIWEGDTKGASQRYTYKELHDAVCSFALALKRQGIGKGDVVCLYLPMIPELAIAMLACARIGAVHAVVFAGFSSGALEVRLRDCKAKILVTADVVRRAGKKIPLKKNADDAVAMVPDVEQVVVVSCEGDALSLTEKDCSWEDFVAGTEERSCPCEPMKSEDTLFVLYTSGSTGTPKGIVHTTGGYLTYTAHTMQWVFDVQEDTVHWCTADVGWITGHSYLVYGPLALGISTVMFEGVPTYPAPDRYWELIAKHGVTVFYTAPTVIRVLMQEGTDWLKAHNLESLRVLGSVGEPISPEAWKWFHAHVGGGRLPLVDTWWQTECGGIMIAALPYTGMSKPGAATRPLPGIDIVVLGSDDSHTTTVGEQGRLCITGSWPGRFATVLGDTARAQNYFNKTHGVYESGDGVYADAEGDFWITGRLDDVINVSGHRLGTAEIEAALNSHPAVLEAAVVGMPHAIKGEAVYAYVTVDPQYVEDTLYRTLCLWVREKIGALATPEVIQVAAALPKTRSGKIMRRVLRKIAHGGELLMEELGDLSTLAEPAIIPDLIEARRGVLAS